MVQLPEEAVSATQHSECGAQEELSEGQSAAYLATVTAWKKLSK